MTTRITTQLPAAADERDTHGEEMNMAITVWCKYFIAVSTIRAFSVVV